MHRRDLLRTLAAGGATLLVGCAPGRRAPVAPAVVQMTPLATQWPTLDPFLFCVHHDDHYPAGNARLGPAASLAGRELGRDFDPDAAWRMYHGREVPGFPAHPHRGFETVTVVRRGLLDHSDSLGAAARYGGGDVQWLTAGGGILHAEMFPLLDASRPNPLELFQIWLNLPAVDKLAAPHFSMLWADLVPRLALADGDGRAVEVSVVAGALAGATPASPPPSSWASRPDSDVAIWSIKLAPGARWILPAARRGSNRMLYFFRGGALTVAGVAAPPGHAIQLLADVDAALEAGRDEVELLLLQGRPIAEPVARHGPFVMNSREEIEDAYADYRATRFGGWPWRGEDPVHPRDQGRFARHADGRLERPA
jgi:hypothetical protein